MTTAGSSVEYGDVIAALKAMFKTKGMTYRDVAEAIGMSESGVKKLMNSDDGSFGRLVQLCGVLGVSMAQVIEEAKAHEPEPLTFTKDQEAHFVANPGDFYFLWELAHYGFNTQALQDAHGLDDASVRGYIAALEGLGMVEGVDEEGEVSSYVRERGGWMLPAKLGQAAMHTIQENVLKTTRRRLRDTENNPWHALSRIAGPTRYRLRPESARELLEALREVMVEFGKRSKREAAMYEPEGLVLCAAMALTTTIEPSDFLTIPPRSAQGAGAEEVTP